VAVATELDIPAAAIQHALAISRASIGACSSWARSNGRAAARCIVDDYGHHPTEVAATLDAVRQGWPTRRLVLAFQPHRYTRTRDLLDDFGRVLGDCDVLLVTEVYAAGEAPIAGADGRAICRAVRSRGLMEPVFVERVDDLADSLRAVLHDGDVVLTMGAGNIGAVAAGSQEPLCSRRGGSRRGRDMSAQRIADLSPEYSTRVLHDVSMAKHTSWHVGGPADLFFTPRDVMDLGAFIRQLPPQVPLLWVGLGSNLLVRDGGIRGAVISTHGALGTMERLSATRIQAEAGVPCARIARQCVKWGLGPAEFFAGIPGTWAARSP
jgi:hypothetical protein